MTRKSRFRLLMLAALTSVSTAGCAVHVPAPAIRIRPTHPAGRVVVTLGHRHMHSHTARCGHYRHKERWYYIAGHIHGRRCGHVMVRGAWTFRP